MFKQYYKVGIVLTMVGLIVPSFAYYFEREKEFQKVATVEEVDEINDSIPDEDEEQQEEVDLPYPIEADKYPRSYTSSRSGIRLNPPSNLSTEIEFDPVNNEYKVYEKTGAFEVSTPYTMTPEEYYAYVSQTNKNEYWRRRAKGSRTGDNSAYTPELRIGGKALDKLFGENTVDIKPQGSVDLTFGLKINNSENPALAKEQQSSTSFDFDSKIQMSVTGSIGDKVSLTLKYDTEAQFDFDNKMKLEYEGEEDDIIQKIEAGDVSFPLTTSLITGSQSLFGFRTDLKFGRLNFSGVFSRQEGETKTIEVEGGAQTEKFQVRCDDYDRFKHYFLAHYFRQHYEEGFKNIPAVTTGVLITDVEIWTTQNSPSNSDARDILAVAELGEGPGRYTINNGTKEYDPPKNGRLIDEIKQRFATSREFSDISSVMANYKKKQDYDEVKSAVLMKSTMYRVNNKLGYISFNSSIDQSKVVAISYRYEISGKKYQVGEFASEIPGKEKVLIVKMLKSGDPNNPADKNWDLMMKNVYSIRGYQISKEDFILDILYEDDKTGTPITYLPEGDSKGVNLLKVMKSDNLTSDLQPYPDGYFDFVEGFTINASKGIIYFPVLEPFGDNLRNSIGDSQIAQKYVYDELYDSTLTTARQITEKNKFIIEGSYKSSVSSVIRLNSTQVEEGSVVVTANGRTLDEDVDYIVDYSMGEVKIINSGILESGTPIQVTSESNPLFNTKTKTLYGGRFDYRFSDNINIGATIIHLSETPMAQKVGFEDYPISNTIWGFDGTYSSKVPFLTTLVDKIPLIETKEESNIKLAGEFAQLVPGQSNKIDDAIEIDYFDNTERNLSVREPKSWKLASIPQGQNLFPEASLVNDLTAGFNRALISWYDINNTFYRNSSQVSEDLQSGQFSRPVYNSNLFPDKDEDNFTSSQPLSLMNIAYYPYERGPYNFDVKGVAGYSAGVDKNTGHLLNPETRWAGIMRDLTTTDFEDANIEYIEFWLLDPFAEDELTRHKGGDLYINLGSISEDILPDGRKSVENVLTTNPDLYEETKWARIGVLTPSVGFDNASERTVQDVGFDGLSDNSEYNFFKSYVTEISNHISNNTVKDKIIADPAGDNFSSFKDNRGKGDGDIVWYYKYYNGVDGNSPDGNAEGAGQLSPDVEDVNDNNTLQTTEAYYQYKVSIRRNDFIVGENFIVDERTESVIGDLPNDGSTSAKWYQFRIPVRTSERQAINGISDLGNVEFMRLFLSGFKDSIVLRMAEFNLVKSDWRKYTNPMYEEGDYDIFNDSEFEISTVNIEENSTRSPVNYILPPGVTRELDPMNSSFTQLNEAAIQLKVVDIDDGNSKAIYKTVNRDFRQFGTLEMFCHAEKLDEVDLIENGDVKAFIRIGSDFSQNYYEYEVPLELTAHNNNYDNGSTSDRYEVWPSSNFFSIDLEKFVDIKKERNELIRDGQQYSELEATHRYTITDKNDNTRKITIKGHPNLSNVKTIMLGIRNPKKSSRNNDDDGSAKSVIVWFNELRLTDFNNKGGWAALATAKINLADFANVSIAGKTSKPGFGSVDQQVFDRSQEDLYQYDFATNIALNKFLPEQWAVSLPFYFDYSESFINPLYDPTNPDIFMSESLDEFETTEEKDSLKEITQEYTMRKSYNFTNVKINRTKAKPRFYNISNLSLTYAYSEYQAHDIRTVRDYEHEYKLSFDYRYNNRPKNYQPFKKLKTKGFDIIKDFNFYLAPSQIGFTNQWNRVYKENQRRNLNSDVELPVTASKTFNWSRDYNLVYNLSKDLKFTYAANNLAKVDEPYGVIDKTNENEWNAYREEVWGNLKEFGETTNFSQKVSASYKLPISKFRLFSWVQSDYKYGGTYNWDLGPQFNPDDFGITSVPGNDIKNSNTHSLDNTFSMTRLYNKSKYLKDLGRKFRRGSNRVKTETVKYNESGINIKANKAVVINHKLKTEDIKVSFIDSKGKLLDGEKEILSDTKISFTAKEDHDDVKVIITGKKEVKDSPFKTILDGTVYMLMMTKTISINWTTSNGTYIPGYNYDTDYFGLNDPFNSSYSQPGWDYVFGFIPSDLEQELEYGDWISYEPSLITDKYTRSHNNSLMVKATLQPINSMRINLDADRTYSENYSQYMVAATEEERERNRRNATTNGAFSISVNTISTAFNSDAAYETFRENRLIVAKRLVEEKDVAYEVDPETGFPVMYNENSQDVLIPAFLAAYTGQDADKVYTDDYFLPMFSSFSDFLNKLNWRFSYNGLSKMDFFKKYFKSVNLTHAYKSKYTIGGYETFNSENMFDDGTYTDPSDLNVYYAPKYEVSSVSISENFNPIIGVDVKWKNNFTSKVEWRNSRNVTLSFTNTEITETGGMEFALGLGYVFKDFVVNIKTQGAKKEYKNDLTIKAEFSIRDNQTIRRIISEDITQKVSGSKVYAINAYGDYMLTERFTIRLFLDWDLNQPVIGYQTSNWNFGVNLRFSLMQ